MRSPRPAPAGASQPAPPPWRRWPVIAATLAGIVVAGCSEDPTDAEADAQPVAVGDCFGTNDRKPVPCEERHLAQTIFVSEEPPARGPAALRPCRTAQAGYLGQDFNSRLDVRLWVATDRSWYRCDLVLRNSTRAGSGYGSLRGSLEGAFRNGVPVRLRACLAARYDPLLDQEYVPCSERHRSRELPVAPAIGTLEEPFPGDVEERARSACNATAAGERGVGGDSLVEAYFPENADAWESGERTADCWVSAAHGKLPGL